MPVDKQVLLRYQVLNKCLRNRYREYTIDDLVNECNKALRAIDMPDISKRTIQYDLEKLKGAPYNIRLNEELKRGKQKLFRYKDTTFTLPLFQVNDEERNKIEDAISLNVYPYHLKQYNDRWYLIAQPIGFERCGIYPLDRIEEFHEVALPYKDSDIDFEEYFDDVVGVTVPDGEPIDITIKVMKDSAGFVVTKPIHLSQRVVERNDDCIIISINVKPNYELDSKILSFGPNMEVLSPESYRMHIGEKIKAMNKKYTDR